MHEELEQQPNREEIFRALEIASDHHRHAELIVQTRLYNFLIAISILFLSWAMLLTGDRSNKNTIILAILALLSFLLSLAWTISGFRAEKFIEVYKNVLMGLEEMLPRELRPMEPVFQLQDSGEVTLRRGGAQIRHSWLERNVTARRLAKYVPLGFALTSVLQLAFSVCGR